MQRIRQEEMALYVQKKGAASVHDLCERFQISDATARRDIDQLAQQGRIEKVHGGARSLLAGVSSWVKEDEELSVRMQWASAEKQCIAAYAAALIEPFDLVFLDSGSSTLALAEVLQEQRAQYVTNSIPAAEILSQRGFSVFLSGGVYKAATKALTGAQGWESIQNFQFTKGFFGTNGIDRAAGMTTPEWQEAFIKQRCAKQSAQVYVLADRSKFDVRSNVRFIHFEEAQIITVGDVLAHYAACKNITWLPFEDAKEVKS